MDILHLVDRLEELFDESRPIWFTHSVMIDEDKILDLIDQMRVSIPEEIKKSQQLLAQSDRIIAKAKEEAANIVSMSKEKSDELIQHDAIVLAAQARADQIIAQARNEAENIRKDADMYSLESLTRLEMEIDRTLNQVRNGIQVLQSEKKPVPPPPVEKPANQQ
jgi:vacuolar-type H+-ATPase subunit H